MSLDYSHRGSDEGPWLPDYEPKEEHLLHCPVWASDDLNEPCNCKKSWVTTAERLDRIDAEEVGR